MSSTTVNIVLPSARVDGSALDISQIASYTLSKAVDAGAATVLVTQAGPFTDVNQVYTDANPDFGSTDNYSATVTDVEGNVSAAGTASVAIPPSQLAAPNAPTVSATFNP